MIPIWYKFGNWRGLYSTHLPTGITPVHLQTFLCFADAASLGVVNGRHVRGHVCRARGGRLLRTGGADVGGWWLWLGVSRAATRAILLGSSRLVVCRR
jgi:hypothetical protein